MRDETAEKETSQKTAHGFCVYCDACCASTEIIALHATSASSSTGLVAPTSKRPSEDD
jgi:hypothetical protein